MANRHAHKKLRAEVRARMRATGESYQQALASTLAGRAGAKPPRVDLVPFSYFGVPATLATIESDDRAVAWVVPSSRLWEKGYRHPLPVPVLGGFMRTRGPR
ncbi:MAG: hypothetical protein FWD17_19360 [Polyangiaceae bacterium]|nr:hypothetical protein [Polyangiaceae bacterium]